MNTYYIPCTVYYFIQSLAQPVEKGSKLIFTQQIWKLRQRINCPKSHNSKIQSDTLTPSLKHCSTIVCTFPGEVGYGSVQLFHCKLQRCHTWLSLWTVTHKIHCKLSISGKGFNYLFSDKILKFLTGSPTNLYELAN